MQHLDTVTARVARFGGSICCRRPQLADGGPGTFDPGTRGRGNGRILDDGGRLSLRRRNLSRLLGEVHTRGAQSRSDLAARLGVNRSTVASLVGELADRGLVSERAPLARSAPGRPSPVVGPRRDGPVVIALEIATDSLAAAVVALGGEILESIRVERRRGSQDPSSVADLLAGMACPLVERFGSGRIVGVGVSVPGVVRREDGFVHVAPNLDWRDVPLRQLVRDRLPVDVPVLVGNDANLATLAEHIRGAGAGMADFVCLWGEAGLGAGIVAGGTEYAGSAGYAGEVGHMPVNRDGSTCRCGARGCWETEVGEDALLRVAGLDASGGRDTLDALFARADAGDPVALAAIESVGAWLGIGLAGLVNLLNPTAVALGGVYARLYPRVRRSLQRELDARALPSARHAVEVVPARLGQDSALLGAAELAFAHVIADPSLVPATVRSGRPHRRPSIGRTEGGEPAARSTM